MPETESATRHDFFINDGAREAGLTQRFWHQAYLQFLKDTESDTTTPGFEMYDIARTIRVPFGQRHFEVLVRCQPDPREYRIYRLTAFTAGDDRQPLDVSGAYEQLLEGRAVLGEAALLDSGRRW